MNYLNLTFLWIFPFFLCTCPLWDSNYRTSKAYPLFDLTISLERIHRHRIKDNYSVRDACAYLLESFVEIICIISENYNYGVVKRSLVCSLQREKWVIYMWWSLKCLEKICHFLSNTVNLSARDIMFSSFRNGFLIVAFLCTFSEGGNLCFDFTYKFPIYRKWAMHLQHHECTLCTLLPQATATFQ